MFFKSEHDHFCGSSAVRHGHVSFYIKLVAMRSSISGSTFGFQKVGEGASRMISYIEIRGLLVNQCGLKCNLFLTEK